MNLAGVTPYVNCLFEQPWWMEAVVPGRWREFLVEEGGQVLARWPVAEIHHEITTPRLTQTSGFWMAPDIAPADPRFTIRKRITNLLLDQLPPNIRTDLNLDPSVTYFLPMVWRDFLVEPRVSYRFHDVSDPGRLLHGFSAKTRQSIRNAEKKVTVEESEDVGPLLVLLDKTFGRQHLRNPWSPELIRRLFGACLEHGACRLMYARDRDGRYHSGNLYVHDEKVCYALLSGSDPAFVASGARTLLAWEGIRYASGVSAAFDFEGSMVEGIEHYFRQFGPSPVVYYHVCRESAGRRARREVARWMAATARSFLLPGRKFI
ncbi:MAG TPA: GNAT family N-acetyltransferase [Prolixibacteraceae bacterium]|mgnify:CR=1 FL=1|jgi:hypothetical protein|nr:GNAT family N-acetyltransferase [Prolixibacteraceae bacterium]HRV88803.1 GNAT family N-acetyltransferase [Prolixibacteraceae bacterium]